MLELAPVGIVSDLKVKVSSGAAVVFRVGSSVFHIASLLHCVAPFGSKSPHDTALLSLSLLLLLRRLSFRVADWTVLEKKYNV